ncbi:hypothetical protein HKCCE3408_01040 [Rhodobacterales bacterium HKCCE3408]|nr:hypothetical protein [Rhodobacterales bacterium HKCCE3408]
MPILTPGFIFLGLVMAVILLIGFPANAAVRRARAPLSADDVKTFEDRFSRGRNRAEMPTALTDLARTSDRAARIWLWGTFAILAILVAIIALGPDLGLR